MKPVFRFVSLGAITTLVSYSTYLAALQVWSPMSAYWCALSVAFVIQAGMMAPFVFKAQLTLVNASKSLAIYAVYSLSFAGLMWAILQLAVPPIFAPLIVITIAAPLQFIASKMWLQKH